MESTASMNRGLLAKIGRRRRFGRPNGISAGHAGVTGVHASLHSGAMREQIQPSLVRESIQDPSWKTGQRSQRPHLQGK
jgi:hypothetical protein